MIATSIVVVGLANNFGGLVVNLTNSEPTGIYLRVPGKPERGGIVALRSLMKHVVAFPGDVVTVTQQGTHVNGQLFPHSATPATAKGYSPSRSVPTLCGQASTGCSARVPTVGTAATSVRFRSASSQPMSCQCGLPSSCYASATRPLTSALLRRTPMKVNLKHTFGKLDRRTISASQLP